MVGGFRLVFPNLMTMKIGENQQGIHNCVCGKLQLSANAFTEAILGNVSFLVSRLPESGKKEPIIKQDKVRKVASMDTCIA